jgi:hypothetical protein
MHSSLEGEYTDILQWFEVAVRASSHIGAGELAFALACALITVPACTSGEAELGESCAQIEDCESGLQCFNRHCARLCSSHVDCGDGYRCERGGQCSLVSSAVGDRCYREIECGPGQACHLDGEDGNNDGSLAGTCQLQRAGLPIGAECNADDLCQIGICSLGRCTQMCGQVSDCPPGLACATVPRLLEDGAPRFTGCFTGRGVISAEIPMDEPSSTLRVPVPSHARSMALVTQVDEADQMVGAASVIAPDGSALYIAPSTTEEFYANPIRYQPGYGVSTLFMSNTPNVALGTGVYEVAVASRLELGAPGTAVPRVRVFYKLDASSILDLHFHFLDLADHPCAAAFDEGRLDAASALASPRFQAYVVALGDVFEMAGVTLGDITFEDIAGRDDLDAVEQDRAGKLFALASHSTGINIFFVRAIAPAGVQAIVAGTPGPPRTPGSRASGLAIGADTLCYRDWPALARITAHAVARQMGLYYNRTPDGHLDAVPDSDDSSANLMFFGDLGGAALSAQQSEVLRRYPGLK